MYFTPLFNYEVDRVDSAFEMHSPSRLRVTFEAFLPGQNDLNTEVVSTLGAKVAGDVSPVSIIAAAFSMTDVPRAAELIEIICTATALFLGRNGNLTVS